MGPATPDSQEESQARETRHTGLPGGRRREMARIELTENEASMLKEILEKLLSQLTFEFAFCHGRDAGRFLRQRKEFLEGFIQRL